MTQIFPKRRVINHISEIGNVQHNVHEIIQPLPQPFGWWFSNSVLWGCLHNFKLNFMLTIPKCWIIQVLKSYQPNTTVLLIVLYRVRHKSVNTRVRHKSVNTPLSHERLVIRTWLAVCSGWGYISYSFTPNHYILRARCVRQAIRGIKGC